MEKMEIKKLFKQNKYHTLQFTRGGMNVFLDFTDAELLDLQKLLSDYQTTGEQVVVPLSRFVSGY